MEMEAKPRDSLDLAYIRDRNNNEQRTEPLLNIGSGRVVSGRSK